MLKRPLTLILALFWALGAAIPASADQKTRIDSKEVEGVMSELRPLLMPLVRTLSRPVFLYHWTNRSSVKAPLTGSIDPRHQLFMQYADGVAKSYFRYVGKSRDMLGNGLYLSVDPVATRHYGAKGSTWVVLGLQAKAGARFLDLTSQEFDRNSIISQVPKDLKVRIESFGCPAYGITDIFSSANDLTAQNGKGADGRKCQALREAIARDPQLRIQGVKYSYGATSYKGCGQRGYAFNVWDVSMFDSQNSLGFAAGISSGDPHRNSKALLQALFDAPTLSGKPASDDLRYGKFGVPYPELKGAYDGKKAQAFMKDYLMGCSAKYKEDNTSFKKTSWGY